MAVDQGDWLVWLARSSWRLQVLFRRHAVPFILLISIPSSSPLHPPLPPHTAFHRPSIPSPPADLHRGYGKKQHHHHHHHHQQPDPSRPSDTAPLASHKHHPSPPIRQTPRRPISLHPRMSVCLAWPRAPRHTPSRGKRTCPTPGYPILTLLRTTRLPKSEYRPMLGSRHNHP